MRAFVVALPFLVGCSVSLRDPLGAPCDERGCPGTLTCRGFVCTEPRARSSCEAPPAAAVVWSQCADGFVDGGTASLERFAMGPTSLGGARADLPDAEARAFVVSGRLTLSGTVGALPVPVLRVGDGATPLVEVAAEGRDSRVSWTHLAQQGLVGPAERTLRTGDATTASGLPTRLVLRVEPGRSVQLEVDGQLLTQTLGGAGGVSSPRQLSLELGPFQVPAGATVTARFEDFELAWATPPP
jgi:hypothetical protein